MAEQNTNQTLFSFFNDDNTQQDRDAPYEESYNDYESHSEDEHDSIQCPPKPYVTQPTNQIHHTKNTQVAIKQDETNTPRSSIKADPITKPNITESFYYLADTLLEIQLDKNKPDEKLFNHICDRCSSILQEIRIQDLSHDFKACLFLSVTHLLAVTTFLRLDFINNDAYTKLGDLIYNIYSGLVVLNDENYSKELSAIKLYLVLEQKDNNSEIGLSDEILDSEIVLLKLLNEGWEAQIRQIDSFFIKPQNDLLIRLLTLHIYFRKIANTNNKQRYMNNLFKIITSIKKELLNNIEDFLFAYEIEEEQEEQKPIENKPKEDINEVIKEQRPVGNKTKEEINEVIKEQKPVGNKTKKDINEVIKKQRPIKNKTKEEANEVIKDKFLLLEKKILKRFKETILKDAIKAKINKVESYAQFASFYKTVLKEIKSATSDGFNNNLLIYTENWCTNYSFRSVVKSTFSLHNNTLDKEVFAITEKKFELSTQKTDNIIQLITPIKDKRMVASKKRIKSIPNNKPYYFGNIYNGIIVGFEFIKFNTNDFELHVDNTNKFMDNFLCLLERIVENKESFAVKFIIVLELPYTEAYKFMSDYNLSDMLEQLNAIILAQYKGSKVKFSYTPFVVVKGDCFNMLNEQQKDQFKVFIKEIMERNKQWMLENCSNDNLEVKSNKVEKVNAEKLFNGCFSEAFDYLREHCNQNEFKLENLITEINSLFLNFKRLIKNVLNNTKEVNKDLNLPIILSNNDESEFCVYYKMHREVIEEISNLNILIDPKELILLNKDALDQGTFVILNKFVDSITITNIIKTPEYVKYRKNNKILFCKKDFVSFLLNLIEERFIDDLYEGEIDEVFITIYIELLLEWFTNKLESNLKEHITEGNEENKNGNMSCKHCKDNLFIG